jgi:hypothetical protein
VPAVTRSLVPAGTPRSTANGVRWTVSGGRMPEYTVIAEADLDAPVICALIAHETTVEIAVNRRRSALALAHVAYHLDHGVDRVQVCSLACDCGYPPAEE